jgi:microcystin degradation protein MlrC
MTNTNPNRNPRIAILGMHLESNAFAPITTEADFRKSCYFEGAAMLTEAVKPAPAMPGEIPGFVEVMNATGAWQPVPILITATEPGGPADQSFFDAILARMRTMLAAAGPLDAIYISNHGAMTASSSEDPDGALYALAREAAGPTVPVLSTVDLHANISRRMFECADCIVSYRTNPHVDRRERGSEAASLIRRLLVGERWEKTMIRMPIMPPTVTLLTARGAYADMINEGQRHIGPDLPVVSVVGSFVFGDVREGGITILTYGRGEKPKALARRLAAFAWQERERFRVQLTPLKEAIARAAQAGREGARHAVCLADVADNPGGGGRGNTTDILEQLLAERVDSVLLGNFVDAAAAARCHAAGAGATVRLTLNENCADEYGVYAGRTVNLGPAAAIRVGGLTMVVCSRRIQCADPVFFETFGLDIGAFASLVVKSRGHFRAGIDTWYPDERIIEVDAAGLTSPMLERWTWKRIPRPVWPLDLSTQWQPAALNPA